MLYTPTCTEHVHCIDFTTCVHVCVYVRMSVHTCECVCVCPLLCCSSSDFMFGLYQMFVGDARPHERDMWLFHVIESMNDVIIPAVRMALKLHEVGVSIPYVYSSCSTFLRATLHSLPHCTATIYVLCECMWRRCMRCVGGRGRGT